MPLIFAIGNPGAIYANTYHSIGLAFAQFLKQRNTHNSQSIKNTHTITKFANFWLLESHVFMNCSFNALRDVYCLHKFTPESLLVLHDELMLPKYEIRLKNGGGNAGHNGLRDISKNIGQNFTRLRIGIDHPKNFNPHLDVANYVLSKRDNEKNWEQAFITQGQSLINEWLTQHSSTV